MPQCAPTWYKPELNQTECPFGREFLWDISVPNVWYPGYPGLSQFSVVIFVGYSIVPFAVTLLGVVYFLRAACGRPWGTRVWEAGKPLHPDDGWRLRNMQEAVKMFGFCTMASLTKWLLAFPLGFIYDANGDEQRWIFLGAKRPDKSCLTTCGMPNGQSLWSYGLLTYFFMELCFRLNLSLLIQKGTYTEEMATLLAVRAIPTSSFLKQTITLFCLLVPVPMSRVVLSDASPEQAIFGILFGIIVAIVYHSLYMYFFKHKEPTEGSLPVRLRCCLARIAMCLEASLAMCFSCCPWRPRRLPQDHGTQLGEPLQGSQAEPQRDAEAPDVYLLPRINPGFIETDHRRQAVQREVGGGAGQRTAWCCCRRLQDLRGFFEFLFVNAAEEVEEMNNRVARAEGDAEAATIRAAAALADAKRAEESRAREEEKVKEAREATEKAKQELDVASKDRDEERKKTEQQMNFINQRTSQVTTCINSLQDAIASGRVERLTKSLNDTRVELEAMRSSMTYDDRTAATLEQLFGLVEQKQEECERKRSEWQRALDIFKARVRQAADAEETAAGGRAQVKKLTSDAEAVFGSMMDAIRAGVNLKNSAEETLTLAQKVLNNWQLVFKGTLRQQELITAIISTVMWAGDKDQYGELTFAEVCFCLQTVQRNGSDSFITEGLKLVKNKAPKDLQAALETLNNLVFLLEYTAKADMDLAKRLFRESNDKGPKFLTDIIEKLCGYGANRGQYLENEAFLQSSDLAKAKEDPKQILEQIKQRGQTYKLMDAFRKIFVVLAEEKQRQYGVLMAPHHTQTIALLIFRAFLDRLGHQDLEGTKALIARVATGEGKSMLIAAQAAFMALSKDKDGGGKKVHVIGTDERLVSRDFHDFDQALFQKMGIKATCLCDSDAQAWRGVWDYDVVYCLPHHISFLYTDEVISGGSKLGNFQDCALLIDEVDALVIDKSPTDPIIASHQRLSRYAMDVVVALHTQHGLGDLKPKRGQPDYEEQIRVYKLVQQLWRRAKHINSDPTGTNFLPSSDLDDAGWVAKDPKSGMPDKTKQSTQLEILRFAHRLSTGGEIDMVKTRFPMKWFEPLFIMSKPLVFGKYGCILGFSGTLGNDEEKKFLRDTYKCAFLDVPEFLKTCGEGAFHTAEWTTAALARQGDAPNEDFPQQAVEVFESAADQLMRVRQLAFYARKHVPVLVIAGSPEQAKAVVDDLRGEAQKSAVMEERDVVRDLSFTQWERNKMDYKDNLIQATQRIGLQPEDPWRITVTDASGGRGTDYKIYDDAANRLGGLLLIVMKIPLSSREWTQYQGRTARQDRRGQMCAVLCSQDYMDETEDDGTALPGDAYRRALHDDAYRGRPWAAPDADVAVAQIMAFGTQYSRKALLESQHDLVAGWRAHELCELACQPPNVLPREKEEYIKWIKSYRFAELSDFAKEAQRLFLGAAEIPACSLPTKYIESYKPETRPDQGRAVVFALDKSGSMNLDKSGSINTRDHPDRKQEARLEICKEHAEKLLTNDVEDEDVIGLLLFDHQLHWQGKPTLVKEGRASLSAEIKGASAERGGTALRDAIAAAVEKLDVISQQKAWQASRSILIVLTDGADGHSNYGVDDLAKKLEHFSGTVLLITVGLSNAELTSFEPAFEKWQAALGGGDRARHLKADWENVDAAFEKVREVLDEEIAGLDLSAP